MKPKIVSGILVTLLFVSFIVTAVNITGVFANANGSTRTQNAADDLLKGFDLNKPQNSADAAAQASMNPLDFNTRQNSTSADYWSSKSGDFIIGVSASWQSFARVEQFAQSENVKIIDKVSMGNKVEAVVVHIVQSNFATFMKDVKDAGFGTYVEPRGAYQAFMTPNDPYWAQQWGPAKIEADYAWNVTTGNKTRVLVAVIDTGIDYNHPDLAANYVPLGYDWVNNDTDPKDDMGHGTHVAGIIGAVINNGVGIAGLAQVRIMAEKALDANGGGNWDTIAKAIIHATDMNASIINMSFGGPDQSTLVEDALKYAYDHGVLLVAAAGNSHSSVKLYPAAYDDVVAVTATDPNDNLAYFSSYGDWVELAAPGQDIYSTLPTYYTTINGRGYSLNYDYLSGTSMASPHVAGVAALVWSTFPNMSRDVLRLHLHDTADDLGKPGFDSYFGYGRVNAYRALTQSLPQHEILIENWKRPPYVQPNATGAINATIINYGSNAENITAELLINGTLEQSDNITNFQSGTSTQVSFSWTPTTVGNYNITLSILPVPGETNTQNNVVQGFLYVGIPLRVFVLRSAGTQVTTGTWDSLNYNWKRFGDRLIYIDYSTLNRDNITYGDLNATKADVLISSCSFAWEYTDSEIEAIKQYVYEGHGFIATAGTFDYYVPNNNKLLPLFGMNENVQYSSSYTSLMNLLEPSHAVLKDIPNPYTLPFDYTSGYYTQTAIPLDGAWTTSELAGGTYIAMGYNNDSAIITYQGLVYISPWLEMIPDYYDFNLQLLYNAITWTRYVKPPHELQTSLQAPMYLAPDGTVVVNATVKNNGEQNESNVNFQFSIYDMTRGNTLRFYDNPPPFTLLSGQSYTISHSWTPTLDGAYNITAYTVPVAGENNTDDNRESIIETVTYPLIQPTEGTWAHYKLYTAQNGTNLTPYGEFQLNYYKYVSPYQMNVTAWETIPNQGTMTGYVIVNTFTRLDERGNIWQGLWFPGMIETNISIGSKVNIMGGPAEVVDSEVLIVNGKVVDCWKLIQPAAYGSFTYWYDKINGLWIKLDEVVNTGNGAMEFILMFDSSNMPVGFTPQHELQVSLTAPQWVPLGTSALITATVSNFGMQNETNVQLNLQINGTIVDSAPPLALPSNTSSTISHQWTPSSPGIYNLTAYAPPVTGENITSDNHATVMVQVVAVKGRVLFDGTHLNDAISIYNVWTSNLRAAGFIVDTFQGSPGNINSTLLSRYDAFVTVQPHMYYADSELAAIKQFIASGGGLLVVGDDYPTVYSSLTDFNGIHWSGRIGFSGVTDRVFHPHAVTNDVNLVYLVAPAAILELSGKAQWLVNDTYGDSMLAVNWYQQGRVMAFADEDSLSDYGISINGTDNLKLAVNMIAWLTQKDITSPMLNIIAPTNGTLIGTTTTEVQWYASDTESGVDHYDVYRNGQFISNTTATTYDVTNLVDGTNNMTVVAFDLAGNHASKTVMVDVDVTPPTLQILSPGNGSYVKQIVAINISGSDPHLSHMDLHVESQTLASFNTTDQFGQFAYLWNTTGLPDGAYVIMLVGYDSLGNRGSIFIKVTIDNSPPIIGSTSPANGTVIETTALRLEWFAIDSGIGIDYFVVYQNSQFIANTSLQSIDLSGLVGGANNVTITAFDKLGNHISKTVTIMVNATPPLVSILSPANASYVRGNITIVFTVQAAGLKNATLTVGDSLNFNVTGMNSWPFDTASLPDGIYIVKLAAYDTAGNMAESRSVIAIGNTSPEGQITSPNQGAFVKGSVTIGFSYRNGSNFASAELSIDGNAVMTINGNITLSQAWSSGSWIFDLSYQWDTTTVNDGTHILALTVTSYSGKSTTTQTTVYVDNNLPVSEIRFPTNGTYVSDSEEITVYGYDTNFANMSLAAEGANPLQVWNTSGTHIYQWNTAAATEGLHTIALTVFDKAGNHFTNSIKVTVHNIQPTVSIDSPSTGVTVSGTININYTTTDANSLDLFIDDAKVTLSPNQNYQWDTTKVVDGNHTIRIVAKNIVNHAKEATISVMVANAPPAYLTYLGYASAAILGLAVGVCALWALRRKPVPTSPVA